MQAEVVEMNTYKEHMHNYSVYTRLENNGGGVCILQSWRSIRDTGKRPHCSEFARLVPFPTLSNFPSTNHVMKCANFTCAIRAIPRQGVISTDHGRLHSQKRPLALLPSPHLSLHCVKGHVTPATPRSARRDHGK